MGLIAQMVRAHCLDKREVDGSIPFEPTMNLTLKLSQKYIENYIEKAKNKVN